MTAAAVLPLIPLLLLQVEQVLGISLDQARPKDLRLIHVRFGFDRTRMQRMHAALAVAGQSKHFNMLPPEQPAQVRMPDLLPC